MTKNLDCTNISSCGGYHASQQAMSEDDDANNVCPKYVYLEILEKAWVDTFHNTRRIKKN